MTKAPLLEIKDLSISFGTKKLTTEVVHHIEFSIAKNEVVGMVGESGSGKSVSSLAIMGLLSKKNTCITGEILFEGMDLLQQNEKSFQQIRGNDIAMIFQEPMSALNPSLTCGYQVSEIMQLHLNYSASKAKKETIQLFKKVKLPHPQELYKRYPHQISGGQMQRVMIAMAIACKPKLLIADEPTTALDVTVQKEILQLLKELQKETQMSMLFISHDLALVSEIVDQVVVMYQGKVVEKGSVFQLFNPTSSGPKNNYTKALLNARPTLSKRLKTLPTIDSIANNTFKSEEITPQLRALKHKALYTQQPILEVLNLKKEYFSNVGFFQKKRKITAVDNVSFQVFEGETLGLVGESGCGKSTLGKTILLLEKPSSGSIQYRGKELTTLRASEIKTLRKEIQLIFQDPYSSLNPRILIGEALCEPLKVYNITKNKKARKQQVINLLQRVGLDESYYYKYPHQLSGGQRQRVGVARTIVMQPKLIVCDESVSALDISVQAQVLNLLNELKEDFGFTYIFISHDLAVVKFMADQLLVMNEGKIEELGDADEIYASPKKEYTKKLIDAIPKGV
ncbi:MAG: ABC transporter ATP-binding protein [Flavobacteriales bacterium]